MSTVIRDFDITLDHLAEEAIRASVDQLTAEDRLTIALRESLRNGADINDISNVTGLPIFEIRKRVGRNLYVLSEDELLAVS